MPFFAAHRHYQVYIIYHKGGTKVNTKYYSLFGFCVTLGNLLLHKKKSTGNIKRNKDGIYLPPKWYVQIETAFI